VSPANDAGIDRIARISPVRESLRFEALDAHGQTATIDKGGREMKWKHWIIAGAASCSLASLAVAQQQPGMPGQDTQQAPGAAEQERAGQPPGAIDQERSDQPGSLEQERSAQPGAMDQSGRQPGMMGQERGSMERGPMGQQRGAKSQGQGMKNRQVVRQVQEKLKQEGYQVGPVDGVWGPKTQSAVREFQQAEGLEATGELDQETLAALEIQGGAAAAGGEAGEVGAGTAAGAAEQDRQQPEGRQSPLESPGPQSPQQ